MHIGSTQKTRINAIFSSGIVLIQVACSSFPCTLSLYNAFMWTVSVKAVQSPLNESDGRTAVRTAVRPGIHVNRPASGGTVPHFHQMFRGSAKSADVPHFSKMVLLFFSLPIILHVCLATQQSDELRIKIGSKSTDYKYTVL